MMTMTLGSMRMCFLSKTSNVSYKKVIELLKASQSPTRCLFMGNACHNMRLYMPTSIWPEAKTTIHVSHIGQLQTPSSHAQLPGVQPSNETFLSKSPMQAPSTLARTCGEIDLVFSYRNRCILRPTRFLSTHLASPIRETVQRKRLVQSRISPKISASFPFLHLFFL
jgi:hypothetical protein